MDPTKTSTRFGFRLVVNDVDKWGWQMFTCTWTWVWGRKAS